MSLLSHLHTQHKLAARATPCIFLGYPTYHHRYCCLGLSTHKILLSQHIAFDKHQFPYGSTTTINTSTYAFLDPTPSPLTFHINSTGHETNTPNPNFSNNKPLHQHSRPIASRPNTSSYYWTNYNGPNTFPLHWPNSTTPTTPLQRPVFHGSTSALSTSIYWPNHHNPIYPVLSREI